MTANELVSTLQRVGKDEARAAEILAVARELGADELERLFSVALRTGCMDVTAARGLITALERVQGVAALGELDVSAGDPEPSLRLEVELLEGRLAELRASLGEVAILRSSVRSAEEEIVGSRECVERLEAEIRSLDQQLSRLSEIEREVPR